MIKMAIYLAVKQMIILYCPMMEITLELHSPPLIVDVFCEQYCIEGIVVIDIVVYAIKGNFVLAD